jgi:hypothetical protein
MRPNTDDVWKCRCGRYADQHHVDSSKGKPHCREFCSPFMRSYLEREVHKATNLLDEAQKACPCRVAQNVGCNPDGIVTICTCTPVSELLSACMPRVSCRWIGHVLIHDLAFHAVQQGKVLGREE